MNIHTYKGQRDHRKNKQIGNAPLLQISNRGEATEHESPK